jgi:hypothetical protein
MIQYSSRWTGTGPWLRLGIVCALMVSVLVACLVVGTAMQAWFRVTFPPLTYASAASATELSVYEPHDVPAGYGEPDIGTYGGDDGYRELVAVYPGGLTLLESNRRLLTGECAQRMHIRGAEESCFGIAKGSQAFELPGSSRALVLRRDSTWIALSGASDPELVRIAESFKQISAPPATPRFR